MPDQKEAIVYEVNLSIKPEILTEFDTWLGEHVSDMLALPGFTSAEILTPDEPEASPRRVVQYRLENRQALDTYLANHASRMREDGVTRFGDNFSAERRIMEVSALENQPSSVCSNCGSMLVTNYCANCGQEDKDYHMSFWRLALDFLGDNFNFDSRLLRSLKPLFLKPGQLTLEYMDGWRARHIPPLRLYLFISIVFFALFAANINNGMVIDAEPNGQNPEGVSKQEIKENVLQKLKENNILAVEPPVKNKDRDVPIAEATENASPQSEGDAIESFFEEKLTPYINDAGEFNRREFIEDMLNKLPIIMFLVLPVYAFFLKVLYLFRKRYYMEHLIFAFHVHAFTFLVFIGLEIWANWIGPWLGIGINGWIVAAITFWIMLYPWFAMRRNYAQGWWLTTLKYFTLGILYFFILTLGILAALFLAILV